MALIDYSAQQAKKLAAKRSNQQVKVKLNQLKHHKGVADLRSVGFGPRVY